MSETPLAEQAEEGLRLTDSDRVYVGGGVGQRGLETCKKVVMNQQLSLTKAQQRIGPQQKHTDALKHGRSHTLNLMFVWSSDGWGRGCSCRKGAYPKSGPIKHLKIKSHCSYHGAIQRRYLCR